MLKTLSYSYKSLKGFQNFKLTHRSQYFNQSKKETTNSPNQSQEAPIEKKKEDTLKIIRSNLKNRFALPKNEKIKLVESIAEIDLSKGRLKLAEIKAITQVLDRDWVGINTVKESLMNIESNFDPLFNSANDLLELECLLANYFNGLIYLEEGKKAKIFFKLMKLMKNSRIPMLLVSKIFQSLANTTVLTPHEVDYLAETTLNLSKTNYGEQEYDKSIIRAINAILIQKQYNSPHLLELLEVLEERNSLDLEIKNNLLFNLENLKVFMPNDPLIQKSIKGIVSKLPSGELTRTKPLVDSNTQKKIAKIMLDETYLVNENADIGIYSVDFFLKPKLIIEYHGFSHYYINKNEIIKLHQMKIDYLRKLGYYVQVIPYFEWHKLEMHENQVRYINEIVYKEFPPH